MAKKKTLLEELLNKDKPLKKKRVRGGQVNDVNTALGRFRNRIIKDKNEATKEVSEYIREDKAAKRRAERREQEAISGLSLSVKERKKLGKTVDKYEKEAREKSKEVWKNMTRAERKAIREQYSHTDTAPTERKVFLYDKGRFVRVFHSAKAAAESIGVQRITVLDAIARNKQLHGRYRFYYRKPIDSPGA